MLRWSIHKDQSKANNANTHVNTVDTSNQSMLQWFKCYCVMSMQSIRWCLWLYATLHTGVKTLCIQWPLAPPRGKAPYSLLSCGFSCSPVSPRRQLCLNFLLLVKLQEWLQARHTANAQFLKGYGALSNLVILACLWQCCILHTLTELATVILIKKYLQCLKCRACKVPWALQGSDTDIVCSCQLIDVPIQRIQHYMLGCQFPHTLQHLIAHTWPWFDWSRSSTPCVPPAQSLSKLVWAWLIR